MEVVAHTCISYTVPPPSLIPFLSIKMYGCFDAYVVYGVMEGNLSEVLDEEWLESEYPDMCTYASSVVRETMGSAVYGIALELDPTTGQAQATEEQKATVQQLYTRICKYCQREGSTEPSIGYFLVVEGDYEKDHREYVPEY